MVRCKTLYIICNSYGQFPCRCKDESARRATSVREPGTTSIASFKSSIYDSEFCMLLDMTEVRLEGWNYVCGGLAGACPGSTQDVARRTPV